MKKIAPSGDSWELPLDVMPRWLVDPDCTLEVNRSYFGYAVRTDRWSCRDMRHDWHMLYLVLEGEIPGQVAGSEFRLQDESLFWLNQGDSMDMTWPERLVFTEIWFRLTRDGRPVRLTTPMIVVEQAGELWPLFRQIEDELTLGGLLSEQKLRHLLATLCIEVLRLREGRGRRRRLSPAQYRRLSAFAREHLAARPGVEDLARVVGLSPDYFSRCFRETFSLPPRDWMIRQRIREATRLLTTTNLAVYQVADQLGYENVSQFSRQFHRHTGQSPRAYSQRHGA